MLRDVMKGMARARMAVVLPAFAATVAAQPPGMQDKRFQEAAVIVLTLDAWTTKCAERGGLKGDSAVVATWNSTQGGDLVRARIRELEQASPPDRLLQQARSFVSGMTRLPLGSPCGQAAAIARNPKNQYATRMPDLLRALGPAAPAVAPAEGPPETAPPIATAPTPVAPPASPERDELLARIESFAFATRAAIGVGGFITTRIYPVVLFRNGEALTDIDQLATAGASGRRDEHWTRWRRQGGELQLQKEGRWEKLPFNRTYPQLPDDFRLDGLFRHLGGAGTLAIGGEQSVTAWNEYRFWPDGRVRRGGGAGSTSASGDVSTATSAVAPERRGRYRVRGLDLTISWDNGSTERRLLVADP